MSQTINPILNKTFLINQNLLRIKDFSEIYYWFIFLVLALFISKPFYEEVQVYSIGQHAKEKFPVIVFHKL